MKEGHLENEPKICKKKHIKAIQKGGSSYNNLIAFVQSLNKRIFMVGANGSLIFNELLFWNYGFASHHFH